MNLNDKSVEIAGKTYSNFFFWKNQYASKRKFSQERKKSHSNLSESIGF